MLLTSSHGHLSLGNYINIVLIVIISFQPLASLRFCRKIVGLKNEFYNRYIVRINLFAPIIKAFTANGQRYNLINSAILELFEYIKSVSIQFNSSNSNNKNNNNNDNNNNECTKSA